MPKQTLASRLWDGGIPGDILMGMPRVLLRGDRLLMVENHRGIVEYSGERMRIRTALGMLFIQGEGLTISDVGQDDLLIGGTIRRLEYE